MNHNLGGTSLATFQMALPDAGIKRLCHEEEAFILRDRDTVGEAKACHEDPCFVCRWIVLEEATPRQPAIHVKLRREHQVRGQAKRLVCGDVGRIEQIHFARLRAHREIIRVRNRRNLAIRIDRIRGHQFQFPVGTVPAMQRVFP